jgi:hypothetical protein
MTSQRLAEIKAQAEKLTYAPTRDAAMELIAEIERVRSMPNSMEVREQMLCERYGSSKPRAMWPVS